MSRLGKIARLSRPLRDKLNARLDNGESAVALADWLNGLPEVKRILRTHFDGRPVSEQNLSEWKSVGFQDWLVRQETLAQTRELAADAADLGNAAAGRLTDHLAITLAARYAAAIADWNGEPNEDFTRKLRTLRALCQDIVELRRGDHSDARLKMEHERLDQERDRTEEDVAEHFKRWAQNAAVRDWVCRHWISPEEKEREMRRILGMDDPPASSCGADQPDPSDTPETNSNV